MSITKDMHIPKVAALHTYYEMHWYACEPLQIYLGMPTDLDDKLNAIVGSAIRALVESGADDAAIGSFAASHRLKVAEIIGTSATPVIREPDIHDVVAAAVTAALEASGIAKPSRKKKAKFNVLVAGKRTCVTLDQSIIDRLSNEKQGRAREVIQDIASRVPAATQNRSAWIEERILAFLSAPPDEHRTAAH